MAAGTPVVAYASSALPETLGGGGVLLPDKDPLLVATAGVALLSIGVTFWLNDAQGHTVAPAVPVNPS